MSFYFPVVVWLIILGATAIVGWRMTQRYMSADPFETKGYRIATQIGNGFIALCIALMNAVWSLLLIPFAFVGLFGPEVESMSTLLIITSALVGLLAIAGFDLLEQKASG